jgi:hypothetical protein
VELINWIWFAGAIASAAMPGIADGKARNIQPIEALWLALLWGHGDVACCNAIWSQLAHLYRPRQESQHPGADFGDLLSMLSR